MNHLNYIYTNEKKIIANEKATFNYSGFLKDISDKVYMRYTTNNWQDTKEVKMNKEDGVFKAEITLPSDAKKIDFAFKNEEDAWDNFYEDNYSFEVMPSTLVAEDKKAASMDVDFFESDYLLEHNLNSRLEEMNIADQEFAVSNSGQVLDIARFQKESQDFEMQLDKKINDIKTAMFESLNQKVESQMASVEEVATKIASLSDQEPSEVNMDAVMTAEAQESTESAYESDVIRFTAKEPYVQMFKDSLLEKEKVNASEESKVNTSYVAKAGEYLYTSKVHYAEKLRAEARENLLKFEIEQARQSFLVVSPYSQLDNFDNSLIGTLQKAFYVVKTSLKKLGKSITEGLDLKETF